jgi:hypothetical protein
MEIINDSHEFYLRVKVLRYEDEFEGIGILPSTRIGIFSPDRFGELVAFCQKNPEYHIISKVSLHLNLNKPVPGAGLYRLARGDKNPNIAFSRILKGWCDHSQ